VRGLWEWSRDYRVRERPTGGGEEARVWIFEGANGGIGLLSLTLSPSDGEREWEAEGGILRGNEGGMDEEN
jgi:hypothetical protein